MTERELIAKPFNVFGSAVTGRHIASAIYALATMPLQFSALPLARHLVPNGSGHEGQEATNRLMQRWRKLGLCEFRNGRWTLKKGAWEKLQLAAGDAITSAPMETRSDETGTGSAR
jgi:hypothetical protein